MIGLGSLSLGALPPVFWVIIGIIAVWELFWKAIALWKAARSTHTVWFIVVLFLNTAGILPLIYLAFYAEDAWSKPKPQIGVIPKRKRVRR